MLHGSRSNFYEARFSFAYFRSCVYVWLGVGHLESLLALIRVNFIAVLAIRIEIGNVRRRESTVSGKKREAMTRRAT